MSQSFVHLNVHSEYSIVDSLLRVETLIDRAVELNMPAVALTDLTNLFAFIKFYRTALRKGIKPIIGSEVIVQDEHEPFRLILLCKNERGYRNLIELISKAYLEGREQDEAIIKYDWLFKHREGLIVLSGGCEGDIGQALIKGQKALAETRLKRYRVDFPNHFYLEIQRVAREQEEEYIKNILELSIQHSVPVVATNAVRFLHHDDFDAHEARVCIQQRVTLDDPHRKHGHSEHQYFKTADEMTELFSDVPEALENALEISKRCSVQISLNQVFLPAFPTPQSVSLSDYLFKEAERGLLERYDKVKNNTRYSFEEYQKRLKRELHVIHEMGFSGYFLIVADFIQWAKQQKILVGPGRGSGAGSLVAYALKITELDPLQHGLLFERFLNPERVSMPDFDIDFCMEGRDRVIDYVAGRYGHHAVAQIITFGTMAARAVVRDVGRVLALSYTFVDKIAKLIPFELGMTLEKALEQEELLNKRYAEEEEVANLIDLAKKLEGLVRNAGRHAGGIVIAPSKLTNFVPLYREPDNDHVVTQFDKDDVETVGLVKFDFLGLRTLTIIDVAVRNINEKLQKNGSPSIDILEIPLDDTNTYDLLKSGKTTAVFQLESRGMKDLIRRIKPESFNDITPLVALFRPGPLQSGMVDTFINCKNGLTKVDVLHPSLEPILRPTYGVILYQDQVMEIARVLSGYSMGSADVLRHAMGKKKHEEMAAQRVRFIEGAVRNRIDSQLAEHIFNLMEKFAGYGFNKSHAAAYALITYQTAWLKTHYPAEFMAAVLSSDMDHTDKVVGFISECREMKLKINPPDINRGYYQFTVNESGIMEYGLGAIKGVGKPAVEHLLECRHSRGPFKNLFDLCQRIDPHKISRRALEPLILSGALDVFGMSRARLMASLDLALHSAEQVQRNQELGQTDLFGIEETKQEVSEKYVDAVEWSEKERLRGEKETLGTYFSGHPLHTFSKELKVVSAVPIKQLSLSEKKSVVIAGTMHQLRTMLTRSGKRMAVAVIEDLTSRIEVTLFHDIYQQVVGKWEDHDIWIIRGTLAPDEYTGNFKLVAEKIVSLDQLREHIAKRLVIRVDSEDEVDRILKQLPDVIQPSDKGRCPISIAYRNESAGAELRLGDSWKIKPTDELLHQLHRLYGVENVALEY